VSAVYALTSPTFDEEPAPFPYGRTTQDIRAVKFGSKADVYGRPYVVVDSVDVVPVESLKSGQELLRKMDSLYQKFAPREQD